MDFNDIRRIGYRNKVTLIDLDIYLKQTGGNFIYQPPLFSCDRYKCAEYTTYTLTAADVERPMIYPREAGSPDKFKKKKMVSSRVQKFRVGSKTIVFPNKKSISHPVLAVDTFGESGQGIVTLLSSNMIGIKFATEEEAVKIFLWLMREDVIEAMRTEARKKHITVELLRNVPVALEVINDAAARSFMAIQREKIEVLKECSNIDLKMLRAIRRAAGRVRTNQPAAQSRR